MHCLSKPCDIKNFMIKLTTRVPFSWPLMVYQPSSKRFIPTILDYSLEIPKYSEFHSHGLLTFVQKT
uniref:Uncharacterized protein n=1 Tax=Arundo donax TaxID=35708 RepID=A0A0A9AMX2_ARUDO